MSGLGLVSHDLQVFGRQGSGDGFQVSHFAGPYEAVIQRKPMLRNRRVLQRDSCDGRLVSGVVLAVSARWLPDAGTSRAGIPPRREEAGKVTEYDQAHFCDRWSG